MEKTMILYRKLWNFELQSKKKLWYYGKSYGTMGKNYGTIEKTMVL